MFEEYISSFGFYNIIVSVVITLILNILKHWIDLRTKELNSLKSLILFAYAKIYSFVNELQAAFPDLSKQKVLPAEIELSLPASLGLSPEQTERLFSLAKNANVFFFITQAEIFCNLSALDAKLDRASVVSGKVAATLVVCGCDCLKDLELLFKLSGYNIDDYIEKRVRQEIYDEAEYYRESIKALDADQKQRYSSEKC